MDKENLKLLVVEDNPTYTLLVSQALANINMQGVTLNKNFAKNAQEALQKFRQVQPDITLLDINLPDSSGQDLLLAFLEMRPDAYINMITSDSQASSIMQAIRNGAHGYILKPFTTAKIRDVVQGYYTFREKPQPKELNEKLDKLAQTTPTEQKILKHIHKGTDGEVKLPEIIATWKVLFADHDLNSQREWLEEIDGCVAELETVSSGKEAMDILSQEHFDVAFIDINLRDIDGYQVANQLRLADRNKPIKTHIVAMYETLKQVNHSRMEMAGIEACLLKSANRKEAGNILLQYADVYRDAMNQKFTL